MKDAVQKVLDLVATLIKEKQTTPRQLRGLMKSGVLSDIFDPNVGKIKRKRIRVALGLEKRTYLYTFTLHNQYANHSVVEQVLYDAVGPSTVLGFWGVNSNFERSPMGMGVQSRITITARYIKGVVDETISVSVNYSLTLAEAIVAGSKFVSREETKNITDERFPITECGMVTEDIILVRFDKDMSLSEILKEFDRRGLRPANLRELLAIGDQHSALPKKFPIVALRSMGQCTDGTQGAVSLYPTDCGQVGVCTMSIESIEMVGCERFAAVKL